MAAKKKTVSKTKTKTKAKRPTRVTKATAVKPEADLAKALSEFRAEVSLQFAQLNQRIEQNDRRFTALEQTFAQMNAQNQSLEDQFAVLARSTQMIDEGVREIMTFIDEFGTREQNQVLVDKRQVANAGQKTRTAFGGKSIFPI